MTCTELACKLQYIFDVLKSIDTSLIPTFSGSFQDIYQNWTRKRINRSWFYEQTVIFAGSTMTVNLDFPQASNLNYVVMMFGSAVSRDFAIRMYMNPNDTLYAEIRTGTGNTGTDYRTCKLEEKYPTAARLQLYFANYTPGESVKIVVQADDI